MTATAASAAHRTSPLVAALLVLVGAGLFGTIAPLSRPVYAAGLTPFAFVAWRVGWGAVFISIFVLARSGVRPRALGLRGLGAATWVGLALATVFEVLVNLAIFAAFARTTIAVAMFVLYTFPALVAVTLVLLGRERLDRTRLVALALALVGVLAVVGGGIDPTVGLRIDALGIAFAFAGAVTQAGFIVVSRDGYSAVPTNTAMAVIMVGTTIASAIVTILADGMDALLLPLRDPGLLALLVAMGGFAAVVPFFLFISGIRRLGGIRTGILMLFEPVVSVSLAAIFLHEAAAPIQVVGGAVVLGAAALVQRGSPRGHDDVPLAAVTVALDEGIATHGAGGP